MRKTLVIIIDLIEYLQQIEFCVTLSRHGNSINEKKYNINKIIIMFSKFRRHVQNITKYLLFDLVHFSYKFVLN